VSIGGQKFTIVEAYAVAGKPLAPLRRSRPGVLQFDPNHWELETMKPMTDQQRAVVERLLSKGWIGPLHYRRRVYLFLPDIQNKRRNYVVRDWSRRPIYVTPTGKVLPSQTWSREPAPDDELSPLVVVSLPERSSRFRSLQKD
jgi:hypothetical protein